MVGLDDIQTFVVNLRRRLDRRARMERLLPPELKAEYTSDWDIPMDGHLLTHEVMAEHGYKLFDWQIESDNPWWNRPLKWGEVGCAIAHLHCWQRAAERDRSYCLVLEDDICFKPDLVEQLLDGLDRLDPTDFDLLYLGRLPLEPDRPFGPGFVRPGYSHCTYGYLLTGRGLELVLAADLGAAIVPVDEFLPAMYGEHPRVDVRTRFPPKLRALAFEVAVARQLAKGSAGSDTESSFSATTQTPARVAQLSS